MPLTDSAVLTPGVGHIFTHPTLGSTWTSAQLTTYASAGTVPTGWGELGHTDINSILTFNQDGGTITTRGSWQTSSLVTSTAAVVDSFTVLAEQVLDNDILTLFHGGGDVSVVDRFAWPDAPAEVQRAALLVMLDGTTPLALSVAKASIGRDGAPTLAVDDFVKLPLRFTILKAASFPRAEWINANLGAP